MGVECLNLDIVDEIWLVPCGVRTDKHSQVSPSIRLQMLQILRSEFIQNNKHLENIIKIDPIEVDNHFTIPTYNLLNNYQ